MILRGHQINAIVFDLDDTLYREYDYVYAAFLHTAEYLSAKYHTEAAPLFFMMKQELMTHGRGNIFNEICAKNSWEETISDLVAIYRGTEPDISLYSDAEKFLTYLRDRGIKTGVITDGDAGVQKHKTDALRLSERVDEIMLTGLLGESYAKPNPQCYKDILVALDCNPENAVYIGDNPSKDFIGAREIGMTTIRIIRASGDHMRDECDSEHAADMTISLLTDLL